MRCECLFRQGCHHQAPGTTTGTTNSERLGFEVGLPTAFAVAPPNGTSPRLGEHMPPAGGNQKKTGRQRIAHPTRPPSPAAMQILSSHPTNRTNRHTNRHTNRARRLGNSYKPYKPYTKGAYFPTPQIVTVCTVCTNSLSAVHGLYDGLYDGLYGL